MGEPKNELQLNAILAARRAELESYQRALDIQWLNNRMEDGRMGRCLALIQREAEMEKDFQERTDHAAIVNARADKEAAIAMEVAELKREEACKLLRRHYLRERDPSLRELQRKLQAGYTCRDLKLQIQNNEYKRRQEKIAEQHANNLLSESLYNNMEVVALEEKEKAQNCAKYCRELQQQQVERERVAQCAYEDTLIEKKMLEEVMRTLADEDHRELAKKREISKRIAKEMKSSSEARQAWKMKQKQMVIDEEIELEKQCAAAADRSSAIIEKRDRLMREKEESNAKMVAKILAHEVAQRERTDIVTLLQEQEYLAKNISDDIAEKEKLERVKRETKEALTEQMETKKRLAQEQKQRELNFRKKTEAALAADKKKDELKVIQQRQKGLQYSQELLQQIQDNAKIKARNQQDENDRAQYVWDCHKQWSKEVSSERKELVRAHGANLVGYLQPGALRTEDLPALAEGATAAQAHLADGLTRAVQPGGRQRKFKSRCNAQCRVLREY